MTDHDAAKPLRERIAEAIYDAKDGMGDVFSLYTENMARQRMPWDPRSFAAKPFLKAADAVLALLAAEAQSAEERVAKAAALVPNRATYWDDAREGSRKWWRDVARAAIRAFLGSEVGE
jgi:hypothetical protein